MRGWTWPAAAAAGVLWFLVGCGGGSGGSASTAAGVAAAASAAPTVTGRVLGEEGPVAGAFLVVGGPNRSEGPELDPASLQTSADGAFALALPPGRWELTAVDPEGRQASGTVDVGGGQVRLDLTLTALPEQLSLDLIQDGLPIEASEEAR